MVGLITVFSYKDHWPNSEDCTYHQSHHLHHPHHHHKYYFYHHQLWGRPLLWAWPSRRCRHAHSFHGWFPGHHQIAISMICNTIIVIADVQDFWATFINIKFFPNPQTLPSELQAQEVIFCENNQICKRPNHNHPKPPPTKKNKKIWQNQAQVFKLLAILSPLACEVSDVKENISLLVIITIIIIIIINIF